MQATQSTFSLRSWSRTRKKSPIRVPSLVLGLALGMTGCGSTGTPSSEAPKAPSSPAAEKPMQAELAGTAQKISHDELEDIMKVNKAKMTVLKVAIHEKSAAMAHDALDAIAEGATKAMGSEPDRNHEHMAAYVALYGGQKAIVQEMKSLIAIPKWDALGPAMGKLGANCSECHKKFRGKPKAESAPPPSQASKTMDEK